MTDDPDGPAVDLADIVGADMVPLSVGAIPVLRVDDDIHVVFRHATESLGLDYRAALRLVRARSWARVVVTTTRDRQDRRAQMVTVDRRTFIMFLATVNEHRVSPDVRPAVVAFQCEAADVLDAYVADGVAVNPRGRTEAEIALMRAGPALLAAHGHAATAHYYDQMTAPLSAGIGRRDLDPGLTASQAKQRAMTAYRRGYATMAEPVLRLAQLPELAELAADTPGGDTP